MLMQMGIGGWIVSLVIGFVLGGVFFMSMKVQVEYVVKKRGPIWLAPACMYARMALLAAVLVMVALVLKEQREKVPAAMLAGVAGTFVARVLIGRMVGRDETQPPAEEKSDD